MANQKLSQLTSIVTPVVTDHVYINQGGVNFKETIAQLIDLIEANINLEDIPFSSATGGLVATNLRDVLRELQDELLGLDADSVSFTSVTGSATATSTGQAIRDLYDLIYGNAPRLNAEYAVADVPNVATYQSAMIMVTDEVGGYTPAFSDGTNWRRTSDRAIVST